MTKVLNFSLTGMRVMRVLILQGRHIQLYKYFMQQTHTPVHEGQIHSHYECVSGEVDVLVEVGEELMIEGLHPVGITTLDG